MSISFEEIDVVEVVEIVVTEDGIAVGGGTKGGAFVRATLASMLKVFVENGSEPPVYLFVDQATASVRQVKEVRSEGS